MKRTNLRIAFSAVVAALAVPVLASARDVTSVDGDPNFPALENPAPALAVPAQADAGAWLRADPNFPAAGQLAPAIALSPQAEGLELPTQEGWEPAHYAVEFAPAAQQAAGRVAKAR